jgi:hypothetical protein
MNDTQLETLDQVRQFLEGTETVGFQIESRKARYRWLQMPRLSVNIWSIAIFPWKMRNFPRFD